MFATKFSFGVRKPVLKQPHTKHILSTYAKHILRYPIGLPERSRSKEVYVVPDELYSHINTTIHNSIQALCQQSINPIIGKLIGSLYYPASSNLVFYE